MVKQARNYMVGAMSGAGLIAAAVVAFVLLVSALVFEDLPVLGLGGGGNEASVSANEPAAAPGAVAGATTGPGARAAGAAAGGAGSAKGDGAAGGPGDQGAQGVRGGGQQSPAGGATTTGSGGSGGDSAPVATTSSSGESGGGATGSASGGGSGGSGAGGGTTTSSPSAQVTNTVNETVNQVDQTVTGGALEATGGTGTTEEVVNGVAGPESAAGKVVDETAKTVEGVVGGLTGK